MAQDEAAHGAPWRTAQGRGGGGPVWACAATRARGFANNFATRETCWACGLDRQGRPTGAKGARQPTRPRSASRPRSLGAGGGRHLRGAPPGAGGGGTAESNAVAKCRKALKALRSIYDEEHSLVVAAKAELSQAEAQVRAHMAPADVLRSALDRQAAREEGRAKLQTEVDALAAQHKSATDRLDRVKLQLVESNEEVAQAQLANAAHTAPLGGDAASSVAALQQLLQTARNSIQQGQDRNIVGGAILEQLVGHVRTPGDAMPRPSPPGQTAMEVEAFRTAGGQPAGFIVGSAYMESVPDPDFLTANYQKLMRIAESMRYFSAPFIFAGDWNTEPANMEVLGFLQIMPAIAVATQTSGTCRSAKTGTYSTVDYWLASPDFAKACGVPYVLDSWVPRPHYPVRMDLDAKPRAHMQMHLKAPKPFPKQAPRCSRASPLYGPPKLQPYLDVVRQDADLGQPEDGDQAQRRLDGLHANFISFVEQDLCHINQVDVQDREKYCGRAEAPAYVWRPAGGPILTGAPAAGPEARCMRNVTFALQDLAAQLERAEPTGHLSPATTSASTYSGVVGIAGSSTQLKFDAGMAAQRTAPRDRDKDAVSRVTSTYSGDASDSGSSSHLKIAVGMAEKRASPRHRARRSHMDTTKGQIEEGFATREGTTIKTKDIHATEGVVLFEWAWPVLRYACRLEASQYILFVKALALTFEGHAKVLEQQAANKRAKSFHKWAQDALITGASPVSGMTKLKGRARNEVDRFGIRSALPQAVADSQMDMWNDIWQGTKVSKAADKDIIYKDVGSITCAVSLGDNEFDVEHIADSQDDLVKLIRTLPCEAMQ
ncbi:unnamed protein product, partial [Prorocentrum cordatum]